MWRLSFPVAGAFDDDLVAGVGQAVEGTVAEDGVVEEAQPFVHGPVAGDDEARRPMAFSASSLAMDAGSSTTSPARFVRRRWAAVLGCHAASLIWAVRCMRRNAARLGGADGRVEACGGQARQCLRQGP